MFRSRRNNDQDPLIVTFEGSVGSSGPDSHAVALRMTNFDKDARAPVALAEIEASDASGNGRGTLRLRTCEDGVARTAVTVTHDLRVGVGTSEPAAALDVRGAIRADSFTACALSLDGDARVANLLVSGDLAVTGMITVGGRESDDVDPALPAGGGNRSFRSIEAETASIGDLTVSRRARAIELCVDGTLTAEDAAISGGLSAAGTVRAEDLWASEGLRAKNISAVDLAVAGTARIEGELDVAEIARLRNLDVAEKTLVAELEVSRKAFVSELEVSGPALAGQVDVAGKVSASELAISNKAVARDLAVTGTATLASAVAMDALAASPLGIDASARAQAGKGSAVCGSFYWRRGDRAPTMITAIVTCSDARGSPVVRAFEPGRNALLGTKDAGIAGADVPFRVPVPLSGTLMVPRSEDVYLIEVQVECLGRGTARLLSYVVRT
jgi:hypothetical protein